MVYGEIIEKDSSINRSVGESEEAKRVSTGN